MSATIIGLTAAVLPQLFTRASFATAALYVLLRHDLVWQWLTTTALFSLSNLAKITTSTLALLTLTKLTKTLATRDESAPITGSRPMVFPCRTTHARMFPKKHSFSYSYLVVGIPIPWRGSLGGVIAADQGSSATSNRSGLFGSSWFAVDAEDYLNRGDGHLGLHGKLRRFLESEGANADDYPYAYLITAPKFLGYSFNPVSFWYLYSEEKELSAMILEVNNTFDERRLYLLKSDSDRQIPFADAPREPKAGTKRFTNAWQKDFHVSPFNSRKGFYSLVAEDPLYPHMTGMSPPNVTITLKSSKEHPKLVARLLAAGEPLDPARSSVWGTIRFMLSWWWVGLVTFPRILREAGKLFFYRRLHVWFRPEPLKESIGRRATTYEASLEPFFREYLQHLVAESPLPFAADYTPSGIVSGPVHIAPAKHHDDDQTVPTIGIKVLTPIFYSRFMHYAHDSEAFFNEHSLNGTVHLTNASLLPRLVVKRPTETQNVSDPLLYVCLSAIQRLRRLPPRIIAPGMSTADFQTTTRPKDLRSFRLSGLDGFVVSRYPLKKQRNYAVKVFKLLLSDWIALGSIELLDALLFFGRCWFSAALVRSALNAFTT